MEVIVFVVGLVAVVAVLADMNQHTRDNPDGARALIDELLAPRGFWGHAVGHRMRETSEFHQPTRGSILEEPEDLPPTL